MKNPARIFLPMLFLLIFCGCQQEKPLISNPDRLQDMEKMLKAQRELTSNALKPIWTILDKPATKEEDQAMKFLFAYMPLSDLADYSPEFMQANVRKSLLTRKEMSWCSQIPEEEFLHFVLPLRVNNENLDSFRLVYYQEIKARIKGLGMKEAALEINHWCHEKVNYRGTDSRTSAPMSTISKTFGRCGEESTFTVSAMRTAGIPARQVYTPRWAHTDDNHAWVEVWIDGNWHFMGACEPDTDLDRGWFSEPSQRTMLIHTRTYGRYFGPEEVLNAEDRFSELNLTARYAKTKRVTILVSGQDGKPVEKAKVEFKLYNYAEFYPIATTLTDKNGQTGMTTGFGDLLVWTSKDGKFDYKNMVVAETDTLRLTLGTSREMPRYEVYDLVPPKALKPVLPAGAEEQKINGRRLAHEDSIRNRTMSTFKDSAWIRIFTKEHGLPADTLMRIFRLSYGNWKEMIAYLEQNKSSQRKMMLSLLGVVSAKDLSDTKAAVLTDHLQQAMVYAKPEDLASEHFVNYVLSPRIELEILSPWRGFLAQKMGLDMAVASRQNINMLINWIQTYIRVDPMANKHSRAPLTPIGVYNLRAADPLSRDIFFVAACRTFGIPARLNPETRVPEYFKDGSWNRATFGSLSPQPAMGKLILKNLRNSQTPEYTLHFTLAKIQNGVCQTLEFEEGKKLTDFPQPLLLETGSYLLVTGKRLPEGKVLSSLTFFEISADQSITVEVTLRKDENIQKPAGKIDPKKIQLTDATSNVKTLLGDLMKNEEVVIVLMDPDSEPSKHILNDLSPYSKQFNNWKGSFIFVSVAEKPGKNVIFQNYQLPSRTSILVDSNNDLSKSLSGVLGKEAKNNLPGVIFCQSGGELFLISLGYKIGIGEQLLQWIKNPENRKIQNSKASCTTP